MNVLKNSLFRGIYEKTCTFAFVVLFVAAMMLPIICVHAGSSSVRYSFSMKLRNVDGWANGHVYSLPKGTATISGGADATPIDLSALDEPYAVNYTLCSKVLGIFVKTWGNVKGPARGRVSGSFGAIDAGKSYYLNIWITNEDHWHHTGSGTIKVSY